ncbi:MAG TPA: hypothetical protein VJV97_00255 [Gemmatimonadaceae bacterium]|nr:hypothetical protein [Gemmatimonadaceae bacterium]
MKSLDSDLEMLCGDLEQLDYVVVKHGDYVCVRLSLISSVRIHHDEGRFRFVPQVGPFRRSAGLFLTSGVAVAAVAGAALAFGLAPLTFVVGFLGVVVLAHDACRFVLTEGCLTRVQQLIASRGMTRSQASPTPVPALGESSSYTFLDQRAADSARVAR